MALAHAELACLSGRLADHDGSTGPRFVADRLLWTIAPSDPETTAALLTKVQTKMNVAGVAGSITVAVLAVVVQGLASRPPSTPAAVTGCTAAGAAVLFAAAWLYLAGAFRLDRLVMPSRFWVDGVPRETKDRPAWLPWRPPSADIRVVQANMQRIWNRFVLTATGLVAVGLILLTPSMAESRRAADYAWFAVPLGLALALGVFTRLNRPVLGVSD